MITEEKKLHLIESLIKEHDEFVLSEVERILNRSAKMDKKKFAELSINLTAHEAEELGQIIEDGCEQINHLW